MGKVLALLLLLAPLLAACGKAEEPLTPELKGRWAAPFVAKSNQLAMKSQPAKLQQVSNAPQPAGDPCRVAHVTFDKRAINARMFGVPMSLFDISSTRREGTRLVLIGTPDGTTDRVAQGKLVLIVRDGEVRFDDIYDERGRSMRYERIPDDHHMRKYGATTIGEMLKLFLDVKPCPSA